MASINSTITAVTRIFSLENTLKKDKQSETGCFQYKVANYISTKTRTKSKYQTYRGQNSYSSWFSFSDIKLSIISAHGRHSSNRGDYREARLKMHYKYTHYQHNRELIFPGHRRMRKNAVYHWRKIFTLVFVTQ